MAADFTGQVRSATAEQLAVERAGDRVTFRRVRDTVVAGKRKAWSEIEVGDTVAVWWRLADKPPRAYRVTVIKKNEP